MSSNPNFYNNFPTRFTFQRPNFAMPPPCPSRYNVPPTRPSISDQDFVEQFSNVPTTSLRYKLHPKLSIYQVKEELRNLVVVLNGMKEKEKLLRDNVNMLSQNDWASKLAEIENSKAVINNSISQINDLYLDSLRKLLAKRSAKRLRLKRIAQERKIEKQNRIKDLKERSRKIDENLQKIKDDIKKSKQEEEAKLQTDIVLKETLRKKHDAKKCVVKLEALLKLYKARRNTARGRGETLSEKDLEVFSSNIDKLKSLWIRKLQLYEAEECDLRATLKQDSNTQSSVFERDGRVTEHLEEWRRLLFGGDCDPQRDFHGDVGKFITVRSEWDQFVRLDGTPLPVGWAAPNLNSI